ncbi:hypothetical protein [Streptomyces sparsogenes]|nr:hypothetical protein [Streptomyces sparsogenes]
MHEHESAEIRERLAELDKKVAQLEELARQIVEDLAASSSSDVR